MSGGQLQARGQGRVKAGLSVGGNWLQQPWRGWRWAAAAAYGECTPGGPRPTFTSRSSACQAGFACMTPIEPGDPGASATPRGTQLRPGLSSAPPRGRPGQATACNWPMDTAGN